MPTSTDFLTNKPNLSLKSDTSTQLSMPRQVNLNPLPAIKGVAKKVVDFINPLSSENVQKSGEFAREFRKPVSEGGGYRSPIVQQQSMGMIMGMAGELKGAVGPTTQIAKDTAAPAFQGFKDLSTKIVEKLKGKSTVSKQFISDLTNSGDVKQAERDVIRKVLDTHGDKVDVKDFAEKVKDELLPLKLFGEGRVAYSGAEASRLEKIAQRTGREEDWTKYQDYYQKYEEAELGTTAQNRSLKYESVALPDAVRGRVQNYDEHIYESPVKTSAGDVHFGKYSYGQEGSAPTGYFGHTRVEDMADGKTRRVIEVQSDLYQKGGLDKETKSQAGWGETYSGELKSGKTMDEAAQLAEEVVKDHQKILAKLSQYNDPTAHFRMIREEVKKAAQDGKSELLFPTGETAMKVEGLGSTGGFMVDSGVHRGSILTPEKLQVGQSLMSGDVINNENMFVVTEVLGDGKFKAMNKGNLGYLARNAPPSISSGEDSVSQLKWVKKNIPNFEQVSGVESFDVSGKIDRSNPIYKFYDKEVGKYLKSKYNATPFTDDKGVTWWRVDVDPKQAGLPVEAFAALPLAAGLPQKKDEKGKLALPSTIKLK